MNPQVLLVKSIAALYLRNRCNEDDDDALYTISQISGKFKVNESSADDADSSIIEGLVNMVEDMYSVKQDWWKTDILQKVKILTRNAFDVDDLLAPYLIETEDEEEYRTRYKSIMASLREYVEMVSAKDTVYKLKRELDFEVKPSNINAWIEKVHESLDGFKRKSENGLLKGMVASVSFDDVNAVKEVIKMGNSLVNGEYVLKTGWQFFNDATGCGGIVRGQTYLYNAITHNGKSFIGSNLIHHIATLNTPALINKQLKPAIVVLSTEDTLYKYMYGIFKCVMERRLGRALTSDDATDEDTVTEVLYEEFESRGYTLHFAHVDASFTRQGLFEYTDRIKEQGFEIHALLVDYFEMFDRSSYASNDQDAIQKDLNYIKSKYRRENTACLLPHQASTDASFLKSDKTPKLALRMAEGNYFKGCRGLDREADFTFAVNKIVGPDGKVYFEFGFNKNKIVDGVPSRYKYAIREVMPYGGIPMDIFGESMTLYDINSNMMDDLEATAF